MDRLESLGVRFSEEPLAKKFGMRLLKIEAGSTVVEYRANLADCVVNDRGQGIVQGGVLVGILADFAAVYTAMSAIPDGHTPLMFGSFSFQRPTLLGELVRAEARIFNISRSVSGVSVRIVSATDNKLKCEGTYHFANPKI